MEVKQLPATNEEVQVEKEEIQEWRMPSIAHTAGQVRLTEEQKEILYAPVKEEDIEIRPDGLIYLPWMEYVSRLRDSFGMEWAIIPQGMPQVQGNLAIWGFYLIIQGNYCGFAIGEQSLNTPTMTWGDACEACKSNAIMRLCKGIGMSLELWKPSYIRDWKEKHAETYEYYNRRKREKETRWKRKDRAIDTEPPDTYPPQEQKKYGEGEKSYSAPKIATEKQRGMIDIRAKELGLQDKLMRNIARQVTKKDNPADWTHADIQLLIKALDTYEKATPPKDNNEIGEGLLFCNTCADFKLHMGGQCQACAKKK